jgi:hypothetical protein
MNITLVLAVVGFVAIGGYIFYERNKQLWPKRKREKYYMNNQDIEAQFAAISGNMYGDTKTDDEFFLGLALLTVLDCLDNPDEYDDVAMGYVFEHADDLAAFFRMKYDKEIKALKDEDNEGTHNRE